MAAFRFAAQFEHLLFIYNIFIQAYSLAIKLVSLWNPKAKAWIQGRNNLFGDLQKRVSAKDKVIWMHCSSAGEFEQGKPLIESLKEKFPTHKILVSFFSPSGYFVAKNYQFADYITYLPLDTPSNAKSFLDIVRPELALFVKYEFWYHHLSVAAYRHIPILLISATFRRDQIFFKKHGGFFRQILFLFRHIFVQGKNSMELLRSAGITHTSISGDTRFDRVAKIAIDFQPILEIEAFLAGKPAVVAGSTWRGDEDVLQGVLTDTRIKLIIAPHEINQRHLDELSNSYPNAVLFSELAKGRTNAENANCLIIDNVGMLSRLYRYATVTYVGGGFTKDGIHNILEAAVWGRPVIFGPNYRKYREAIELIAAGGAFSISDETELKHLVSKLLENQQYQQAAGSNSKNYVMGNVGATKRIIQFVQANRLLTS